MNECGCFQVLIVYTDIWNGGVMYGIFSELDIDNDYYEDYSYPSPEMELRWRIEDLKDRLDEISKGNYGVTAHYFMGCQFSEEDLAYTPPEYFSRASDILAAITIAEDKIAASEEKEIIADIDNEIDGDHNESIPGQLTIWDFMISKQTELTEAYLEVAA